MPGQRIDLAGEAGYPERVDDVLAGAPGCRPECPPAYAGRPSFPPRHDRDSGMSRSIADPRLRSAPAPVPAAAEASRRQSTHRRSAAAGRRPAEPGRRARSSARATRPSPSPDAGSPARTAPSPARRELPNRPASPTRASRSKRRPAPRDPASTVVLCRREVLRAIPTWKATTQQTTMTRSNDVVSDAKEEDDGRARRSHDPAPQ